MRQAEIQNRSSKVNAKIRDAQLELIPYMFIVGPKEAEQNAVAVRDRIEGDLGPMPLADAIAKLKQEADERIVRQVTESTFSGIEGQTEEANEY